MSADMRKAINVDSEVKVCSHFCTVVPTNVFGFLGVFFGRFLCIQVLRNMQACIHTACSISKHHVGDFRVF